MLTTMAQASIMASRPEHWPQFTSELLPNILFTVASQYPDLIHCEYPRTDNVADGFRKITFKEVANAAHAVAWWIEENVGKPANNDGGDMLVYMGPNDLCYALLVLGSVMAGYKVRSPLNRFHCWQLMTRPRCSFPPLAMAQKLSSPPSRK